MLPWRARLEAEGELEELTRLNLWDLGAEFAGRNGDVAGTTVERLSFGGRTYKRPASYRVAFDVSSSDLLGAFLEARTLLTAALVTADVPQLPLTRIAVTALQQAGHDRELAPRLAGVAEIAELTGLTRQRVSVITRTRSFPAPAARLACGPIWLYSDVTRFFSQPRSVGRPKRLRVRA